MSLQSIRFWLLLWLSLFSWRAYQTLRSKRRLFTEAARNAFAQLYPGRALLSLLWPFAKWIVPSLAVLAGWGAYLVYCANHLLIDAQRVPEALFSPGAWLARQASFYLASNQVEGMPVYSYLLNGHLHGMILTLGLLSVCFLWIGLKKGSGKSCGVRTQTSVHEKARPEDLESF